MRLPNLEFGIVFAMGIDVGDDLNAISGCEVRELGERFYDVFCTRKMERAGFIQEIELRIDVEEERFHDSIIKRAESRPTG